jgi:ribosome-associated translation inhibitor RaiA
MRYSDDRYRLRVEIQAKGCDIPFDERARMQASLAPLGEAVKDFPASDLWVNVIYHPRSQSYHVEFKLKLPGQTLFTGERDPYLDAAFQRCVRKLVWKVEAYREHPDRRAVETAEQRTALAREVMAPEDPDAGPLAEAVREGDYRTFRTALAGYEEWLRKRVGRWVQRYPEAESQVGDGLFLGDLVEEVYLNAFEGFPQRPTAIRLSEWLDRLIDPSLKALLRNPDEERQNASLARTLREGPL